MSTRAFFLSLVLVLSACVVPHAVHAGGIPFWGPIVPTPSASGVAGSDVCPLGWGAVIVVINNIVSFLLTFAIVFVLPIAIAYAGFMYVINPISAEGRSDAKRVALNAVLGIVIALGAWMLVDAVMAALYDPGNVLGDWKTLISSKGSPLCLKLTP